MTVAEDLDEERIPTAMAALSGYRHTIVRIRHLHVLEEVRDDEDQRVWRPIAGVAFGPPSVVGRGGLELVIEVHDRVPPDAGALGADREPADVVLVARRDHAAVGVLGGRVRGAKAWLEWVEVDPAVEGRGSAASSSPPSSRSPPSGGPTRVFARAEPGERAESFLAGRGWSREDPPPMVRGRIGPIG